MLELEARRLLAASVQGVSDPAAFVTNLYETVLFREPTADDLDVWTGFLARGASERAVTRAFLHSDERAGLVSDLGVDLNGSPQEFVDSLYANLLGGATDDSGEAFWVRAVRKGADREAVIQAFLDAGLPTVPTALSLSVTPGVTTAGNSVTLSAVINPAAGSLPAMGSVAFFSGKTPIAMGTIDGFSASATTSALAPGADAITAVYLGDSHYRGSTSDAATVTINAAPTATTLAASSTNPAFGDSVAFTAGVTSTPAVVLGNASVPGQVAFFDGTTQIGTDTLTNGSAGFSTSALAAGAHSITAVFQGGSTYTTSTSAPVSVTVARVATSTALAAVPTTTTPGSPVLLTATVSASPASLVPGGTVEFFAGATDLGPGTLSNGKASLTSSTIPQGVNQVTAVYAGDATFLGSTSPAVSVGIGQMTITDLFPEPRKAGYTDSINLVALVTATGLSVLSGTVEFFDGTTDLGPADVSQGQAVFPINTLTGGVHQMKAVFSGSAPYLPSTSTLATVTITPAAPQVNLSASQTNIPDGGSVTLSAIVLSSTGNGTTSGSVSFFDGTTPLGTKPLVGQEAQLTTSSLPHGSRSITVKYSGDTNFAPGTSAPVKVNVGVIGTTTSVTPDPATAIFGVKVRLDANITPDSGTKKPTGLIDFFAGSTFLGTAIVGGIEADATGRATLTTSTIPAGSTSITAVYKGTDEFGTSTSSPAAIDIFQAPSTTQLNASSNSITAGAAVQLSVHVIPFASGVPTGTVSFFDGTTPLGTKTLDNTGSAVLSTSALTTLGEHSITADYSGDSNNTSSKSFPQNINVGVASKTALQVVPASTTFGDKMTFTATVSPGSGAGMPTGTVQFFNQGSPIDNPVPLVNGVGQDSLTLLPGGNSTLTAVYSGDATFASSTSPAVPISIARLSTTTKLTAAVKTSPFADGVVLTSVTTTPNSLVTPLDGNVQFFAGTTLLGTGQISIGAGPGTAPFFTFSIPLGTDIPLTAVYQGDGNFQPSTSNTVLITITQAPSVTTLSASPTSANFGDLVTLTASVSNVGVTFIPDGSVQFLDGQTPLGTAPISQTTGNAVLPISTLSRGTHSITAVYPGNTDFLKSTSKVVLVTIS